MRGIMRSFGKPSQYRVPLAARHSPHAPPMEIVPSLISSRPASIRSKVDLPQPDGPTRTTNSPSLISTLTPCMTLRRAIAFDHIVDCYIGHLCDPLLRQFNLHFHFCRWGRSWAISKACTLSKKLNVPRDQRLNVDCAGAEHAKAARKHMRVAKDVFDPRFADHGCPRIVLDRLRLAADHHNTAARTQSFEHRLGRLRAAGGFEYDINSPASGVALNHIREILTRSHQQE